MRYFFTRSIVGIAAIWSSLVLAFTTGCASGGYKLTREYSGWVNRQNIILRIILFILTLPVYVVTLAIDLVIFNTMDFWDGRVSQGTYKFNKDQQTFIVKHKQDSQTGLRQSRIEIVQNNITKTQIVLLKETPAKEIEFYIDGVLRGKATSISTLPQFISYNNKGVKTDSQTLWPNEQLVSVR